jgi:hypothetical protein
MACQTRKTTGSNPLRSLSDTYQRTNVANGFLGCSLFPASRVCLARSHRPLHIAPMDARSSLSIGGAAAVHLPPQITTARPFGRARLIPWVRAVWGKYASDRAISLRRGRPGDNTKNDAKSSPDLW